MYVHIVMAACVDHKLQAKQSVLHREQAGLQPVLFGVIKVVLKKGYKGRTVMPSSTKQLHLHTKGLESELGM